MSDDVLQQAAELFKKGDKEQASKLLSELVNKEPRNASAWYGLAICLNETEQKRYCLQRVLEINPDNAKAKQMLEGLQQAGETRPGVPEQDTNIDKVTSTQPAKYQQHQKPSAQEFEVAQKKPGFNLFQWIMLAVLGVLTIGVIGLAIYYFIGLPSHPQSIPAFSETPTLSSPIAGSISLPETWTPNPTDTMQPEPTLRPSFTPLPTRTPFVLPSLTLANTQTTQPTIPVLMPSTASPIPIQSTKAPAPQTTQEQPTARPTRQNTPTRPPETTVSCGVSPSVVPGASNVTITFYANFSPPIDGSGFSVDQFDQYYPGQRGCSGSDGDGDGYASCEGRSGAIPYRRTVRVTFSTSVGDCTATFRTN